jgi:hypothetical protein
VQVLRWILRCYLTDLKRPVRILIRLTIRTDPQDGLLLALLSVGQRSYQATAITGAGVR